MDTDLIEIDKDVEDMTKIDSVNIGIKIDRHVYLLLSRILRENIKIISSNNGVLVILEAQNLV